VATAVVIGWAITGPIFHYSYTWQLVINTGTTIITFLLVFLIQNTQNRDTLALQLKLDELLSPQRHGLDRGRIGGGIGRGIPTGRPRRRNDLDRAATRLLVNESMMSLNQTSSISFSWSETLVPLGKTFRHA
jgi:Low affinity iron permease